MIGEPGEPGAPGPEGTTAAHDGYRSSRVLSRWLVGALLLCLALNVAMSGAEALVTLRHPSLLDPDREFTGPGEFAVALGLLLGGLAAAFVFVSCVVLFCVWIHRANRNARALGARGMEFTPGWAAGWFFVPIANLFKPYEAMREIYQASDPGRDEDDDVAVLSWHWSKQPAPAQMKLWWGTLILMNLLENASLRWSFRNDPASQTASTWLGVAGAAVAVPCTLFVIWLVLEIEDRQARRKTGRSGQGLDAGAAS
jgi:Domain of unknown function (DUF4328)